MQEIQESSRDMASSVPGIVVQGTGEVMVRPDIARLMLGVQTQAKEASQAARENADRTDALIKAIRGAGVAERDIRTSNYSINPNYDYRPQEQGRPPIITGYIVNNNVNVTVRKIADVGKVIDAATNAGANMAGGIFFDIDDPAPARREALKKAVADAADKAKAIADAAGLGSISIVSVVEGSANFPRPMLEMADTRMAMAGRAAASTPVQPGEQAVTATVTVRYRTGVRQGE